MDSDLIDSENDKGLNPQFRLPEIKGRFGLHNTKVQGEASEPAARPQDVVDSQTITITDDVDDRKTNRRYNLDERTPSADVSVPRSLRSSSPSNTTNKHSYDTLEDDDLTKQPRYRDSSDHRHVDNRDDNDNVTHDVTDARKKHLVDTSFSDQASEDSGRDLLDEEQSRSDSSETPMDPRKNAGLSNEEVWP